MQDGGTRRPADRRPGFGYAPAAWLGAVAVGAGVWALAGRAAPPSEPALASAGAVVTGPDFNRDVRPILSNTCFKCHGPDSESRKAGLRLDVRDVAIGALESGRTAIVPGDVSASELVRRITSDDPEERMPPAESGKQLTPAQIETLRAWVEAGAVYRKHWSFEPPVKQSPPGVSDESWCRNEIDRFILARLDSEGLAPSRPASAETLLRRVTFDLTGLPPTPEEVEAFGRDGSPGAYERVVDRLLASPRYGEHMARSWLDAARYGDTHGLHLDNAREMWPWRDWVIRAFNDNMPFDEFTIEQIAGDMLPGATRSQVLASGFNRNHVSTSEGGAIADEFQIKNVADRLATTGTVWMGLTLGCAHCHEHKFDPISHTEYYQLFAFFNNTTEEALDGNRADWGPIVRTPSPEQEAELASMDARIAEIQATLDAPAPETDLAQERWRAGLVGDWTNGWRVLEPEEATSAGGATLQTLEDGSVLAGGNNPAKDDYEIVATTDATGLRLLRLEALTDPSLPFSGPGRADNANFVLSEIEAEAVSVADPSVRRAIHFVGASADFEQMDGAFLVRDAIDGVVDDRNGWATAGYERRQPSTAVFSAAEPFGFEGGTRVRVRLRFQTQYAAHAIGRVRLSVSGEPALTEAIAPAVMGEWHSIGPFVAEAGQNPYDEAFGPESDLAHAGGEIWTARPEWTDGEAHTLTGERCATYLARTISSATARRVTLLLGTDDAVKVWLNGRVVHENNVARALTPDQDSVEVGLDPGENLLVMKVVNFAGGYAFTFRTGDDSAGTRYLQLLPAALAGEPSPGQADLLRRTFRREHSPEMRALYDESAGLAARREALHKSLPFSLVMEERTERRPTYRLNRGEYDQPREVVQPDVPSSLPPLAENEPHNRLGLAEWLVDRRNPLTARVTVNRFWQQVFGVGIVKTAEDFGSQGEWPSHPELLDWLAVEFEESGWDVKALMRRIVTSAAYMQDSAASPELRARDPENRLLARGPRVRLEAEEIRDGALFAGGLLVEQIGGPSVKPYQPPGLWKAVAYPDSNTRTFMADTGEKQYRRSMYTYWKRTSPPPNMLAFDAPSRETCTVRRARTDTPLQSLVLLNDPQFVESARAMAQRVLLAETDTDARLALAFELVVSRRPDADELAVLRDLYEAECAEYRADASAAEALLSVGESPRDGSLDPAEHAAMTNVASTILSLDEAITKG
ncbi:MAG: PSD1 domain-containing protein [Phycisphaerales bacterium]|nr:PSD1 domain-containing protein [Phycisphaerales bacterium]